MIEQRLDCRRERSKQEAIARRQRGRQRAILGARVEVARAEDDSQERPNVDGRQRPAARHRGNLLNDRPVMRTGSCR
jgi:hypothetical protein